VNEEALAHWWLSRQKQTENVGLSGTQLYSSVAVLLSFINFVTNEKLYFHITPSFPAPFAD